MDSPRYELDGPVFGDELDERELKEVAEQLDKEEPGWEDKDNCADNAEKDDPLAAFVNPLAWEPDQPMDEEPVADLGGGGAWSSAELEHEASGGEMDEDAGSQVLEREQTDGGGVRHEPEAGSSIVAADEVGSRELSLGQTAAGRAGGVEAELSTSPRRPDDARSSPYADSTAASSSSLAQLARSSSSALVDDDRSGDKDEDKDVDKDEGEDKEESVVEQPSLQQDWSSSPVGSPPVTSMQDNIDNKSGQPDVSPANQPEDKDESDESEEGEDEEEEEEEEEEETSGLRRSKRRKVSQGRSRFIEYEAEVDEDDEDYDEEDVDYAREAEGFIDEDDMSEGKGGRGRGGHQRLDRRRRDVEEPDAEQIVARLRERYVAAQVYRGDEDNLPQTMLVPSVDDPKLWQVRVKPGREKHLIFSIMRKSLDLEYTDKPLKIFSAFQRDSLPGILYVEGHNRAAVEDALDGLIGVYLSKGIHLVPIDETPALLKLTQKRIELEAGAWVRIKRGRYRGDIAQVIDVSENGEEAGLRFIPRINLSPTDDDIAASKKGKRKKSAQSGIPGVRPPAKFFSSDEVAKAYGRGAIVKRGNQFIFQGDTYADGFIEKDLKLASIETQNVAPTMDEAAQFRTGGDDGDEDYLRVAEQARQASMAVLQSGDVVEVTADQNKGAVGTVITIAEGIVRLRRTAGENAGAELTVRGEFVKKLFRQSDHVKVIAGKNLDETGLVLSVVGDDVMFLSDLSKQVVTVFAKDIRVASEVGSGLNTAGTYNLHEMLQLEEAQVGIIIRTERQKVEVLDLSGKKRSMPVHQLTGKVIARGSHSAYTEDRQEIRKGQMVTETIPGGQEITESRTKLRSGVVLAIRGLNVFVYNRDIQENEGVFVVSARALIPFGSKAIAAKTDLTRLNPDIGKHSPVASNVPLQIRHFRDPLVNTPVVVVKGIHKARVGRITDVNGEICRVELESTSQTITVKKDGLLKKDPRTGLTGPLPVVIESDTGMRYRRPSTASPIASPLVVNPYANDGGRTSAGQFASRTPGVSGGRTVIPNSSGEATPSRPWGYSVATPNPYGGSGGRTPVPGATTAAHLLLRGARTPVSNSCAVQGGRTPAYGAGAAAGGRTSALNGTIGGRTPAYSGMIGARAPAHSGAIGARTPAYSGAMGALTPAYGALAGSWTPADSTSGQSWSAATPAGAGSSSYSATDRGRQVSFSAPTPGSSSSASGPTSDTYSSAPTPGDRELNFAAPTPGSSADDWE